jgi:hypothetical protein
MKDDSSKLHITMAALEPDQRQRHRGIRADRTYADHAVPRCGFCPIWAGVGGGAGARCERRPGANATHHRGVEALRADAMKGKPGRVQYLEAAGR